MKNIMIITPFYPYPQKSRLKQDSKAVYYLCQYNNENERVIIVYYYQHTRFDAVRSFPKLLKRDTYHNHVFHDDHGHDILLFEHPCLIPHSYKTFRYFDKIYAKMIEDYLEDNNIVLDSVVVHFPVRFTPLAEMIKCNRKVAILHSFDVEVQDRLIQTNKYMKLYECIGFRSKQIEQKYCEIAHDSFHEKKMVSFLCLSGVPNEIVNQRVIDKEWKKDGILHLSFAGRLNKNKNVETIIRALSILKDRFRFEFVIMGDGEEKENLEKLIFENELESNVLFKGNMPRDQVLENLYKSDVFILLSFKETLGISYLEAMASGNIVIGSKGRGIDGIAKDKEEAFFVEPNDFKELANIILEIYSMNYEDIKRMRNSCYMLMTNLTEICVSRRYLECIQ